MSDEDQDAPEPLGSAAGELLLYATPSGRVQVRVLVRGETVWLPQKQIAQLFAVGASSKRPGGSRTGRIPRMAEIGADLPALAAL